MTCAAYRYASWDSTIGGNINPPSSSFDRTFSASSSSCKYKKNNNVVCLTKPHKSNESQLITYTFLFGLESIWLTPTAQALTSKRFWTDLLFGFFSAKCRSSWSVRSGKDGSGFSFFCNNTGHNFNYLYTFAQKNLVKKIKISLIILYIYVNIFFKWFVISAVTRTEKHFAPTSVSASFAARSFNLCQKDQKHNEKKNYNLVFNCTQFSQIFSLKRPNLLSGEAKKSSTSGVF